MLPCFWDTSAEDGYVESLRTVLPTVSVKDLANISNAGKKKVSNVLMHCLVKSIFYQVYLDPRICLLMATSKQSISAGHSWHCLSVLSAAKEREDVKSISLSLRKTLKLISSEANTDDVVEAANILTTK